MVQAPSTSRLSPAGKNLLSKDMERTGGSMNGVMVLKKLDEINHKKLALITFTTFIASTVFALVVHDNSFYPGSQLFAGAIGVVVSSLAAGAFLFVASMHARKVMESARNQFKEIFKTEHPTSRKEVRLMQKYMERGLCYLAHDFRLACDAESEFLKVNTPIELEKVVEARKELKRLQREIRKHEDAFWTGWRVAKLFGFKIFKSIKEYWMERR